LGFGVVKIRVLSEKRGLFADLSIIARLASAQPRLASSSYRSPSEYTWSPGELFPTRHIECFWSPDE